MRTKSAGYCIQVTDPDDQMLAISEIFFAPPELFQPPPGFYLIADSKQLNIQITWYASTANYETCRRFPPGPAA
jgi:hypothetical protein